MSELNDEWVPEIGQVVMASWVGDDGDLMDAAVEVSAYRDDKAWVTCCGLDKVFKLTDIKFRPLKTEAEKRRDEAVAEMLDIDPFLPNTKTGMLSREDFCKMLYDNGFRKPKPLTEKAIQKLINKHQDECKTLSTDEFAYMVDLYVRGYLDL